MASFWRHYLRNFTKSVTSMVQNTFRFISLDWFLQNILISKGAWKYFLLLRAHRHFEVEWKWNWSTGPFKILDFFRKYCHRTSYINSHICKWLKVIKKSNLIQVSQWENLLLEASVWFIFIVLRSASLKAEIQRWSKPRK